MKTELQRALADIDSVLADWKEAIGRAKHADASDLPYATVVRSVLIGSACVRRWAPVKSVYREAVEQASKYLPASIHMAVPLVSGALEGLRADISAERLDEYEELVHADVFADFLDMAQHLLDESYKDAAAVLVGGVLEEHLRKLCGKVGIPTEIQPGQAKKASTMNADLKKASVYNNLDEKSVTAQLELRNNAAHGKYKEYSKDAVRLMLETVRDLIRRHPA